MGALGLDPQDWTERYLKAYSASGEMLEDDRIWTAFAANVGKARIQRRDAVEEPPEAGAGDGGGQAGGGDADRLGIERARRDGLQADFA